MRRSLVLVLLIAMFESGRAIAATCSSLDGQKYCSCEYNQQCTSSGNSCACARSVDEPQTPVLISPPPGSLRQPAIRPQASRREPALTSPAPVSPALVDDGERTPAEYVQLAKAAITGGRLGAAIDLIDKGQTRLLDRSVTLNKTFDPIPDEPIKQLSMAKQALLAKNR